MSGRHLRVRYGRSRARDTGEIETGFQTRVHLMHLQCNRKSRIIVTIGRPDKKPDLGTRSNSLSSCTTTGNHFSVIFLLTVRIRFLWKCEPWSGAAWAASLTNNLQWLFCPQKWFWSPLQRNSLIQSRQSWTSSYRRISTSSCNPYY